MATVVIEGHAYINREPCAGWWRTACECGAAFGPVRSDRRARNAYARHLRNLTTPYVKCSGTGSEAHDVRKFGRGYYPTITARCPECGRWMNANYAPRYGSGYEIGEHAA